MTDISMTGSSIFYMIGAILNILSLVIFISTSLGLYWINKKLWEKHAWLSFIPLIQIYSYVKASWIAFWKNFFKMILTIIISLFVLFILWSVLQFVIWSAHASTFWDSRSIVTNDMLVNDVTESTVSSVVSSLMVFLYMIAIYIPILLFFIKLYHWISKRCGRGAWTTVWFIFIPYIMFPVVGYKLKDQSNQHTETPEKKETVEL